MIRIAMLSFWHVHAKDYAEQAQKHPETQLVALWDEEPERGKAEATERGLRWYDDLEVLLAQPDIDAVIVDTPTTMHHQVLIAAAQAGKHIFTEKVLAPTLHECDEIIAAVKQSGIKLMVSLPRLYHGYTITIKEILAQGLLGQLTLVRVRLSHNGAISTESNPQGWLPASFFRAEQTHGGAMIDLGCHPMYLARYFLGAPESIKATYGSITGREVEDNAVAVLRYANGALGIVEAGFVNRFSPFSIEVHGTEGSLLYGTQDETLHVRSSKRAEYEQWREWPLANDQTLALWQWVEHIQHGTTATENIQLAVELTWLMEAANGSAQSGEPVRLNTLAQ